MKEFGSCEKCKYRSKSEYEYPCERCTHGCIVKEHYEPMTNADRIRDMDDEELAEFLCNVNQYSDMQVPSKKEVDAMIDWLQSEVEE